MKFAIYNHSVLLMLAFSLLCLFVLAGCGEQYSNPIEKECKQLCEQGVVCFSAQDTEIDKCRTYCGIEQWNYLCLQCGTLDVCEDMLPCIYKYCDMRLTEDQCEKICNKGAECIDEYVNIEVCRADCSTNKNMFDCLSCLDTDSCLDFLECAGKNCRNDLHQ